MKLRMIGATFVLVTSLTGAGALAQNQPGGPPPGGGFDPAQFRKMMSEQMKQMLGASDDEWTVLDRQIEKVRQLQRDASLMGMMFGPPRGGPGGPNPGGPGGGPATQPGNPGGPPNFPSSPVRDAAMSLQTVLQDKSSTDADVTAKLAELRAVRAAAKDSLTKAQDSLRDMVSQRQEAVLVTMGVLE